MTNPLPQHIAIIMDGNGRWAEARGLPRLSGHKQGVEALRKTVRAAADLGIEYLTFFGFSSENWSRPDDEVLGLMNLLRFYLRSETAEFHRNNAKLMVIGDRAGLDGDIVQLIENAEDMTQGNTGITVVVALNYGGRGEILSAARQAAQICVDKGGVDDEHFDDLFTQSLMTKNLPDPDLLIRTSGEQRISNFLLWQCAYSELVFTDTLWPDFAEVDLRAAIDIYASRERRFGGIKASLASDSKSNSKADQAK